jgi:hypothetical protein
MRVDVRKDTEKADDIAVADLVTVLLAAKPAMTKYFCLLQKDCAILVGAHKDTSWFRAQFGRALAGVLSTLRASS